MPSEEEKDIGNTLATIFVVAFVIAIVVIFIYWNTYGGSLTADHTRWAEFGDFVGGVLNPVFGFLGLFALLLTISLQSKELKLTNKELSSQNKTLILQNFENSFFQMLRLHNDIVNSIDFVRGGGNKQVVTTSGRDCFPIMVQRLSNKCRSITNITDDREVTEMGYRQFYEEHQLELGHYFRYLYNIFKFIHNSDVEDKYFYSNLVRAQISNHELVIIFYNCISKYGREKFLPLAAEYSLFKNMPSSILLQEGHLEWL